MKVAIVHNNYGKYSGEEAVVSGQKKLLEDNGHTVCAFERSSAEIPKMFLGQLRAFLGGIYNPFSRRAFKVFLEKENPDMIHVHHLYPLVSPSILPVATKMGIPVVMTVHNYRLVCPNGLHYSHNEVCTKCEGGREYWCVIRNCEKSINKSFGYALRNWWSRKRRYYLDNVSVFACLTNFQHDSLVRSGINTEKIVVVPNMVQMTVQERTVNDGEYVGFSGRLSHEKGINVLADVACRNSDIAFKAAGNFDSMPQLKEKVPENFSLLGYCNETELSRFYENARLIVLPSVWFEGFPMVILEAMLNEKAVICSDIGGLSDIVEDGVTGLLAKPGDDIDLEEKIRTLWQQPELCRKMGLAGREKVLRDFSKERYYERLINVYNKATLL